MMKGQQMNGSNCALCDIEITRDNDSLEHIVPNGMGGRRRVRGFLCRDCNSRAGEKWDAVAAEQLNFLCLLFAIQRERGTVRAGDFVTESGERVRIHSEGYLTLATAPPRVMEYGSTAEIKARVPTRREARKLMLGFKRRYPKLDVDEAMRTMVEERRYLSEPVKTVCNFGGAQSGRCVVKSALALAVASGIKAQACEEATNYLRNNDGEACFGYFYGRDLVTSRPADRVFHCVAIKGDSSSRRLVGYVVKGA
jgi:HNH endonuclease